jgi:hypothetical protein
MWELLESHGPNMNSRKWLADSRNVRPGQGRIGFFAAFRGLAPTAIHVLPLRGQNSGFRRSQTAATVKDTAKLRHYQMIDLLDAKRAGGLLFSARRMAAEPGKRELAN